MHDIQPQRPPIGPLLLFIVSMTVIMTVVMSFAMTALLVGFDGRFLPNFGRAVAVAFLPGLVAAFLSKPLAENLVRAMTGREPLGPKAKLPAAVLFIIYMTGFMALFMSFAMTGYMLGFDDRFVANFLLLTFVAYWPALLAAFVAQPLSQRLVKGLLGIDPLAVGAAPAPAEPAAPRAA